MDPLQQIRRTSDLAEVKNSDGTASCALCLKCFQNPVFLHKHFNNKHTAERKQATEQAIHE